MIFRKQKKQSLFDRTVSPRISARMNNLTSFRCCSCCSCQCYSCVMSRYSGFQNVNPQTFLFGQPVHTYPNTYFVQQNHNENYQEQIEEDDFEEEDDEYEENQLVLTEEAIEFFKLSEERKAKSIMAILNVMER